MSKEFLDRLNNNSLTRIDQYEKMTRALAEMKREDDARRKEQGSDWEGWELAPVWTGASSQGAGGNNDSAAADDALSADSVQAVELRRAMQALDRQS